MHSGAADLPPFPDDIPTHPLLIIDYERIKAGDAEECERLWTAGTTLGFWYLKNHGADEEVCRMFGMGAETMALPLEEKMRFAQGADGVSFGYKAAGASAIDAAGTPDTAQFINIAKDDALAWPVKARRTYPSTVNAHMQRTIKPFVEKSVQINDTLLAVFNDKLGLPAGTLARLHKRDERSASETRVLYSLPIRDRQHIAAHTDFGSLSFLHNRLGGLQVRVPGSETWQFVKPLPDHAICNLGDAMAIFSGGILRSNLHRVVNPPGLQACSPRFSLVYFTRPADSVVLAPLSCESRVIAAAAAHSTQANPTGEASEAPTALAWFTRRIKNQLLVNRKGPETWFASRGTEHAEQERVGA